MFVPNGTPGAETPGPMDAMLVGPVSVPEGSPEALLFGAGSESPVKEQPSVDETPQAPTDEPIAASDDAGTDPQTITEPVEPEAAPIVESVDTPDPEDEADLLTYPEAVRERFKKIPRADRRAFWEHAGAAKQAEVDAANARSAEIKRQQDADAAEAQRILESQGKYVGEVPIELPDGNGGTIKGPTFNELQSLLSSGQDGRNELWTKYGLDEDVAIAKRNELQRARSMLASTATHMEQQAWGKTAFRFKTGLVALVGSEAEANAIVDGAGGPEGVLARLGERHQREIAAVEDRHQRERAVERKNYQDRIDALAENQDGMAGKVLAATNRDPATGGRSAGGDTGELTLERYQRMSPEEAAKVPRSEIDRLTSRHVSMPR